MADDSAIDAHEQGVLQVEAALEAFERGYYGRRIACADGLAEPEIARQHIAGLRHLADLHCGNAIEQRAADGHFAPDRLFGIGFDRHACAIERQHRHTYEQRAVEEGHPQGQRRLQPPDPPLP